MARNVSREELVEIIRPLVGSLGFSLWGVEFASAGNRTVLRLYIDAASRAPQESPEADAGGADAAAVKQGESLEAVSIKDCVSVSRHVGMALEVDDVVAGAYVLEVSSPGLDRIFFSLEQAARFVGREVEVELSSPMPGAPFPGRKRFKGELKRVEGEAVHLDVDSEQVSFEWDDVKKMRLAPKLPEVGEKKQLNPPRGGKKSGKKGKKKSRK